MRPDQLLFFRSIRSVLLVATGIIVTLLLSWSTSMRLRLGNSFAQRYLCVGSVFCFQCGFFSAWAASDIWIGSQRQLMIHAILEVVCVLVYLLFTGAEDTDSQECTTNSFTTSSSHKENERTIQLSPESEGETQTCMNHKLIHGLLFSFSFLIGYGVQTTVMFATTSR